MSYLRLAIKLVSAILLTLPTRAMYRFRSELLSPSLRRPRTTALYFFSPERRNSCCCHHGNAISRALTQSPQPVTILEQSTNTSPKASRLERLPQPHHPVSELVRNFQICNRPGLINAHFILPTYRAHTHTNSHFFPLPQDSICQSKFFFLFRAITGQLSSIKVRSDDHRWLHRVQNLRNSIRASMDRGWL